jgi:hypothetical protein
MATAEFRANDREPRLVPSQCPRFLRASLALTVRRRLRNVGRATFGVYISTLCAIARRTGLTFSLISIVCSLQMHASAMSTAGFVASPNHIPPITRRMYPLHPPSCEGYVPFPGSVAFYVCDTTCPDRSIFQLGNMCPPRHRSDSEGPDPKKPLHTHCKAFGASCRIKRGTSSRYIFCAVKRTTITVLQSLGTGMFYSKFCTPHATRMRFRDLSIGYSLHLFRQSSTNSECIGITTAFESKRIRSYLQDMSPRVPSVTLPSFSVFNARYQF